MKDSWRAVQVLTNHEKRVAQRLAYRSLEHDLPLYVERSEWTDRTVTLERPLFPGYLFTRFPPQSRLELLSTPGVIHLLGKGLNDSIPGAEIERIRTAIAQGYSLRPHPRIRIGMCVRIKRGIFASVKGIVTELRHSCRVVLELSGVDQCFSLEAKPEDLEVLDGLPSSIR
jgi:transcription antitermination factor NusG